MSSPKTDQNDAPTTSSSPATVTFNATTNDVPGIGKGKSSLLRELTSSWSAEPVCVKYSLKDDRDFIDSNVRDEAANGEKCDLKNASSSKSPSSISFGCCAKSSRRDAKMEYSGFSADENWKKKRTQILRQCAEYLELESVNSKYTKDNFRRGFLNKVFTTICFL